MFLGSPLVSLLRQGYEEIRIFGELVVVDGRGILFQSGEIVGEYPARSLLKPFQFLAAGIASEKWVIGKGDLRYVPCLGSISATEAQVRALQKWWGGSTLIEKLGLPPSYPMDERHRIHLMDAAQPAQKIFHPCFSKHLAILEGCERHGWSFEDYLSVTHPYHLHLRACLARWLERPEESFSYVTDGCLLPSPALALTELAELYRMLAEGNRDSGFAAVRDLMRRFPEWIGGSNRLDSLWMGANSGAIIAKEGADGIWGIGVVPCDRFPQGLGIVLKLSAGYHPTDASIAVSRLLESVGLKSVHEFPRGQRAVFHYDLGGEPSKWIDISPDVDADLAVWPGDVAFCRTVSMDAGSGQHMTLSSIQTTVHAGAHTDAPNHFQTGGVGIDEVPVDKYFGACQVITVTKGPGATLGPQDVADIRIRAPRILFRTGSFPNPRAFNSDFVALSADLIDYLKSCGVSLVGIDTPSIDPCDSKELPAHHATAKADMAILEGIVLDGIKDGLYLLNAVPLRLNGADASPVRALLKPWA